MGKVKISKKGKIVLAIVLAIAVVLGGLAGFYYWPIDGEKLGLPQLFLAEIKEVRANIAAAVGPMYVDMEVSDFARAKEFAQTVCYSPYSKRLTGLCEIGTEDVIIKTEKGEFTLYSNGALKIDGQYYMVEKRSESLFYYFINDIVNKTFHEYLAKFGYNPSSISVDLKM